MRRLRSLRILRRHWKLTAISVFSLAIAMALGVLALSVLNTVLLLAPPAPAPDRLAMIYGRSPTAAVDQVSYLDYQFFRKNNRVFTDIAAAPNSIGILGDFNFNGREVSLISRPVSENYFAVLGIRPYLGRLFAAGDDDRRTEVAVMTYSCWQRLGSDPHIVGKVLAKNTIIGVTPKDFTGTFYGFEGDLFTTLANYDDSPWREQRMARRLALIARLKAGIALREAQADLSALAGQLASAYPKEDQARTAVVTRATILPPEAMPTARLMSAILMLLVLLVLLIACANVANLLLAIAVGRRQEAAIKLALGAPRARLIREFLVGSAVLSAAGTVLGFLIAAATLGRLSHFAIRLPTAGTFSIGVDLRLDATVLALTLVLTLLAGLATGLAPACYASSPALSQILSGEIVVSGTRKTARRYALVVVQVAVCTLVLVGMGLCQRNLFNLRHADLGFSARNLISNTVYLQGEGYDESRAQPFYNTLRQTVAALPGVESVALAWDLPLLGASQLPVQLPDSSRKFSIAHTVVDLDYFSTLGIKILAGRPFNSSDRANTPQVAVINQKMAAMFWPGRSPLGQVIRAGDPPVPATVIGVAADGKYVDLDEAPQPFLYYPLSQHPYRGGISVIARTKGDPRLWIAPLARALRGLGLKILIQPETLDGWMTLTLLQQRIAAGCVAVLSALGLILAMVGLFGAISHSVSERKKELGLRIALGAVPRQLLLMILRQTAVLAGAGIAFGILLGIAATVVFRSQLYGVSAVEWNVLLPVAVSMLAISVLVAALSARPWLAVDPMEAVRHA